MADATPSRTSWTVVAPPVGLVALLLALLVGQDGALGPVVLVVSAVLLAAAVLAAVHHAEVVAHRVGEPFGSLVLAVAVTIIEVALILTLMIGGGHDTADARARHRVRRGDDHLQRHRRAEPARRRRALRHHAASTPRAPAPRWPR